MCYIVVPGREELIATVYYPDVGKVVLENILGGDVEMNYLISVSVRQH
jgi:hypothetical protein